MSPPPPKTFHCNCWPTPLSPHFLWWYILLISMCNKTTGNIFSCDAIQGCQILAGTEYGLWGVPSGLQAPTLTRSHVTEVTIQEYHAAQWPTDPWSRTSHAHTHMGRLRELATIGFIPKSGHMVKIGARQSPLRPTGTESEM